MKTPKFFSACLAKEMQINTSMPTLLLSLCFALVLLSQCQAADPLQKSPANKASVDEGLKRSEVVFARPANSEAYRQYGVTLVAWGFRSWKLTGEELTSEWRRQCDLAHGVGAKYQARVELDAGWRGWIDFDPNIEDSVCRTVEGQLLTYPFWTSTYKGKPAYHGCTNAKGYRRYLLHQAQEALSSNPDMLMIDAIMVTSMAIGRGGCFCDSCVAGFREYVQTEVPSDVLVKLGIQDVAAFDYGEFLRQRSVSDGQFAKQVFNLPATLPLAQEYRTFQHVAARKFVEDFRRRVETIAGRRILLSTNSPLLNPGDWWAIPAVDFFTSESAMNAKSRATPREPVFRYKLADALGVRVLSTGTPKQDWAFVRDNNLHGLVRTWIAQAYAYGHQFMVPHNMWCGEGQKSGYQSQPGDCDDLYQFVREHADLLDGLETVADVGVLYCNTAFRRGQRQAQQACYELTKRNIPFRLIAAGDEWMPVALHKEDLAGLKALVATNPGSLNSNQRAALDAVKGRTVAWPDEKRLFELVPSQINVIGATNVTVLPRAKPDDPSTLVCHLLNGNYLPESDSMQPLSNLTITLDDSLLPSSVIAATLLTPGREAAPCSIVRNGHGVAITVPTLDLWALLKLEMRDPKPHFYDKGPE
jgi:hypothetical protein